MTYVFTYPGVYWSARLLAIVFMAGATWLTVLMLARFFRPKHVLGMLRADPPQCG